MQVKESGGSECPAVTVEIGFQNLTRPERVQTSGWCLIARESEESSFMKQANDGKGNFAGAALPPGRQRGVKTSDAYCKGSKITKGTGTPMKICVS